jgi:hypothetical protein
MEQRDATIASQRSAKHISMATNKQAAIVDAVFLMRILLGNDTVNTFPCQGMKAQQWRSLWRRCLLLIDKLEQALVRTPILSS